MCGRFGVEPEYVQLALRYQATIDAIESGARYNIAPTQPVAVVLEEGGQRILTELRWGLVPHWAKDPSAASRLINA
jgi:putative SOS response-associated peptidase YedK